MEIQARKSNLVLLNNAVGQTGWQGGEMTKGALREAIRQKVKAINWEQILNDVTPFLEKEAELDLLTPENLLGLLK